MCRPSWTPVKGAPLKGCIVWTLTKPNWFSQILTEGQVEVCVSVYVWVCWLECVHASVCTCLIWFTCITKKNLCIPNKQHNRILLSTTLWWWQLVCGGLWQCPQCFARCFDAIMYLCVILAPCHSSFLLQASSVNAAIYCESSPPSGRSNCFGFEAGEIESTYTHRRTLTLLVFYFNVKDSSAAAKLLSCSL